MKTDPFARRVFFRSEWDKEFKDKGYIKVPFLTESEVESYKQFYLGFNKRDSDYNPEYAEFSVLNATLESRKLIYDEITGGFKTRYDGIIDRFKPVIANYVCKEPNGQGAVPIHQNWAVVDEKRTLSISIWCPLVDCSEENGTLHFVDGSHKPFRGVRGAYANEPFAKVSDELLDGRLTPVNIKAGEAIFLDDSTIHYSHPNRSRFERLAIQLIVVPEEEQIIHYRFDPEGSGKYEVFGVDPAYFLGMVNWRGDLSNYPVLGKGFFKQHSYSIHEFNSAMAGGNSGVFGKVFKRLLGRVAG